MDELTGDPTALRAEARRLRHTADLVTSVAAGAVQQVGVLYFSGPAADRLAHSASIWRARAGRAGDELLSVAFMLERAAAQIEEQASSHLIVDFGWSSLPISFIGSAASGGGATGYVNLPNASYSSPSTSDSTGYINVTGPGLTTSSLGDTGYVDLPNLSSLGPSTGDSTASITIDIPDYAAANVGYVDPLWYGLTHPGAGIPSTDLNTATLNNMGLFGTYTSQHYMENLNPHFANPIVII